MAGALEHLDLHSATRVAIRSKDGADLGDEVEIIVRLVVDTAVPLKAQRPALHRQGDDHGTEGPNFPIKHDDTEHYDLVSVADHQPTSNTSSGGISVYPQDPHNRCLRDNHVCAYFLWVGTNKSDQRERIWQGRKREPMVVTVLMVVRAGASLAVEVKTPTKVGSRAHSMTVSEAATAVRKALKEALRQLAGGPGMLVVGGFNIDAGTFTALGDAAGEIVKRDGSESNLMAIVDANFTVAVGDTDLGLGPSEIGFGQKSRMRSNRFYSGPIEFVGDWNGEWELVSRARLTINFAGRLLTL